MEFADLSVAARALLLTTCSILNRIKVSYAVAGGWIPVLRGGAPELNHPGTRDVDVLFKGPRDEMSRAAAALLDESFLPSAKHQFQLLRPIDVGGRTFIFNVDFMHQGEADAKQGEALFSDIFDLGIPDAYDPTGKLWLKSIAFRSSAIIFEQSLWSYVRAEGRDISGSLTAIEVPLMDEAALILSKAESLRLEKRPRDAFDLFYVLSGPAAPFIEEKLCILGQFPAVADRLENLQVWISKNEATFDANVGLYGGSPGASRVVMDVLYHALLQR